MLVVRMVLVGGAGAGLLRYVGGVGVVDVGVDGGDSVVVVDVGVVAVVLMLLSLVVWVSLLLLFLLFAVAVAICELVSHPTIWMVSELLS